MRGLRESSTNNCTPELSFFPSVFVSIYLFISGSGVQLAHTYSTVWARISLQWFSKLGQLWKNIRWWVAHEFISLIGSNAKPGEHNEPTRTSWVGSVCVPPALLADWPGSFTCHCDSTKVERTMNKSRNLILEKTIIPRRKRERKWEGGWEER